MNLPFDMSPEKNAVLEYLSKNWTNTLLERPSFQTIVDSVFNDLKHFLEIELNHFISFSEIVKEKNNGLGKRDLPIDDIHLTNTSLQSSASTILITRKLYDIDELRIALVNGQSNEIKVNQNILKLYVDVDFFKQIELCEDEPDNFILSKYIAYYFLSTQGKSQLASCLESKTKNITQTLKINKLKALSIPFHPKVKQIVEDIEEQVNWVDAEKYYSQLDHSVSLFQDFEQILLDLNNINETSHFVATSLYSKVDFALLLAKYLVHHPQYSNQTIAIVFESHIHYQLFLRNYGEKWQDEPIRFYWPECDAINEDLVIVTRKITSIPKYVTEQKIIYLSGGM